MGAAGDTPGGSRLARLARGSAAGREAAAERCDLCGSAIAPEHRHLLDMTTRELRCACRPCALLFDRPAAAEGHLRLVPERRLRLMDFELGDLAWEELRLPVDIAFFFRSAQAGRVVAMYPGPMGATESLLTLDAWAAIETANPVLSTLEDDVEALLVHRAQGARGHWLVPIDVPYELVGLIRVHWRGLTGGKAVWQEIGRFTAALDATARPASRTGRRWSEVAAAAAAEGG